MYRFFDKHGKKVLAVAASLLMVAFLLPSTAQNGCFRNNQERGTISGQDVNPAEIAAAEAHLHATQSLAIFGGSVADYLLYGAARPLSRDSLTFYLLLREAREAGVAPNADEVDAILAMLKPRLVQDPQRPQTAIPFDQINPAVQTQLKNSIAQVLMVRDYFHRSMTTVKISEPLVNQRLAMQMQQARARVVAFNAKDFQAKATAPTRDQLEQQFSAYRRSPEGVMTPENPFGFGYLVPDKARFQYVAVPDDQIAQAIAAERDEKRWDEDARVHYLRNPAKYSEKPKSDLDLKVGPTTGPTTAPSTQPTLLPFEAVRERVLKDLRAPLIETLQRKIVNRIAQQLASDYQHASSTTPAPTTQQVSDQQVGGLALGSTEYLLRIRDDIQKQFKVTITVVNDSNLISRDDLQKRPGIGMSSVTERGPKGDVYIPAATYLYRSLAPLIPADKRSEITPLQLYQPSKPLSGGGATYIVRAVAAEPARPAEKLDDVKDRVEKDVWRKLAFQLAVDAAQAAIKQAEGSSLAKIEGARDSEWFGLDDPEIPGLPDSMLAVSSSLVTPIFNMQQGIASRDQLPVRTVIRLETSDTVVAAELFDIRTTLTPDVLAERRLELRRELAGELARPLASDWFSPDAVAKRVGYTAPKRMEAAEPNSSNTPAPAAPRGPVPGM